MTNPMLTERAKKGGIRLSMCWQTVGAFGKQHLTLDEGGERGILGNAKSI